MFPFLDYLYSIDQNMFHPRGVLMRVLKGGVILNLSCIENHNVRKISRF